MTKAGDVMMLAGMFLIFFAGTFGFTELLHDQSQATGNGKGQSPCSAFKLS
jgi:NADH-quinone oxidoreductase subunit L